MNCVLIALIALFSSSLWAQQIKLRVSMAKVPKGYKYEYTLVNDSDASISH